MSFTGPRTVGHKLCLASRENYHTASLTPQQEVAIRHFQFLVLLGCELLKRGVAGS